MLLSSKMQCIILPPTLEAWSNLVGPPKPHLRTLSTLALRKPTVLWRWDVCISQSKPLLPSRRDQAHRSLCSKGRGPHLGSRWKWGEGKVTPLWRPRSNPPGVDPPPRGTHDLCRTKCNTRLLCAEQTPGPAWRLQ